MRVMCFQLYMQPKLLTDKGKCSSQLKPRAGLRRKTTWLFLSIGKIKEGAQVSGRKMDELITALMRRGRGTGMPFHHPAMTAAGQRQSRKQTGRLQQPFNLGSRPLLSALAQGPAAATIWAIIPARRRREDVLERNQHGAALSSALWFLSWETIITFPSTSSKGSKCIIFISGDHLCVSHGITALPRLDPLQVSRGERRKRQFMLTASQSSQQSAPQLSSCCWYLPVCCLRTSCLPTDLPFTLTSLQRRFLLSRNLIWKGSHASR